MMRTGVHMAKGLCRISNGALNTNITRLIPNRTLQHPFASHNSIRTMAVGPFKLALIHVQGYRPVANYVFNVLNLLATENCHYGLLIALSHIPSSLLKGVSSPVCC